MFNKEEIIIYLKRGLSWKEIAERLGCKSERIRKWCYRQDWYKDYKSTIGKHREPAIKVNNAVLIDSDQRFTADELIAAHGMDPKEFKLVSAKSNEWTTPLDGEPFYNYQTKITVEPKTAIDLSFEELNELLNVEERSFKVSKKESDRYLYIPLSDLHFGWNSLEEYSNYLDEIVCQIQSKHYDEILVSMHGDYFHVDNFLGTTEKGTKVDDIDFEQGVKDGFEFIQCILENAIKYSNKTTCVYLPGNHAPSVDYMISVALQKMYHQVEFDISIEEYKAHMLGNNLIVGHHGDKIKNVNRLLEVVVSEFPELWGRSSSRFLFTGHFHHEKSLSTAGMTHYQLQSPSKPSSYDKKYGYITAECGIQLFEFTKDKRIAIYYY